MDNKQQLRAYQKVKKHLSSQQDLVINTILFLNNKPTSCEGVARRWGKYPSDISGRFTELKAIGLIEVSGEGLTSKGNPCDLFVINTSRLFQMAGDDNIQRYREHLLKHMPASEVYNQMSLAI
jgi:predicted transcriptional regulator